MNRACEKSDDSPMPISFLLLLLSRGCRVSLATQKPESSNSLGGKKNCLRSLWYGPRGLLRPKATPGSRPPLRRHADLPRTGNSACSVPKVRQGETGNVSLPGQQPVLHQAVCLLRWQALQYLHRQGCCPGVASGPQDGQRSGKTVAAGETPSCPESQAQGHRY